LFFRCVGPFTFDAEKRLISLKGDGVFELRVDYGPGYRVYFAQEGARLVLLLCGGDKKTQNRDIRQAKKYWKDYESRKEGKR
jgi:putative addiction module killer protein